PRLVRERLLRALALGDVADRAHREHAFFGLERAQADLDGELLPVLPPTVELHARTHFSHARIMEVPRAMRRVPLLEAIGHQDLDGLTEQLVAREAEQTLGLGVDDEDAPAVVDEDHGIRCRLEERAKLRLRLLSRREAR